MPERSPHITQEHLKEVPKNISQTWEIQNLQNIVRSFQSGKITPKEKKEWIDYLIHIAWVESAYQKQTGVIQQGVQEFISGSLQNKLPSYLGEYKVQKFDADKNRVFDSKEEQDYTQALKEAITHIILLGWINDFANTHAESAAKNGWSNSDKWLANKVDLGSMILGENGEKKVGTIILQKYRNISEARLHEMEEASFRPTKRESWDELTLLLAKEFWDGIEDVIRFLTNIPAGIILIPRYLKYRTASNSSDPKVRAEGEIKIKELTTENSSLAILDLLWEKWA